MAKNIKNTPKKTTPKAPTQARPLAAWAKHLTWAAPLIAFVQVLNFGFVMHDDDKMLLENPLWGNGFKLSDVFTTDAWFMPKGIELYRPWQSLTYTIDFWLTGGQPLTPDDALVFHVHNWLIFGLNGWLLYLLLRRLFPSGQLAVWGAVLYSLTLLNVHAVSWIPARGDLYLFTFGVLNLLFFDKFLSEKSAKWAALSVLFFVMALLAKESAVALLPIAGAWWLMRKRPDMKPLVLIGVIEVVAFLGYNLMRQKAVADIGAMSIAAFFKNLQGLPEEVFKMFVPIGFSVMPTYSLPVMLGGLVMLGLVAFAVMRLNLASNRIVWLGLVWWLASLLPSMAYKPSFAGVAYDYLDHRGYFAMLGFALIVLTLADAAKVFERRQSTTLVAVLVGFWALCGNYFAQSYAGWEGYYQNALKTNPESGLANLNYSTFLRKDGKLKEARDYCEKAVRINPTYSDGLARLSEIYFSLGEIDSCYRYANMVIEKDTAQLKNGTDQLKQVLGTAYQLRGIAFGSRQLYQESLQDLNKACQLWPRDHKNFQNRGTTLKNMGQFPAAIADYDIAAKGDSTNFQVFYDRGFSYGMMGQFDKALADMQRSTQLNAQHGLSWYFMARALIEMKRGPEACNALRQAQSLGVAEAAGLLVNCQ